MDKPSYADAWETIRRAVFAHFASGDVALDLPLAEKCREWSDRIVACSMAGGVPAERLSAIRTWGQFEEFLAELRELDELEAAR